MKIVIMDKTERDEKKNRKEEKHVTFSSYLGHQYNYLYKLNKWKNY